MVNLAISPAATLAIILAVATGLLLSNKLSPDVIALCIALTLRLTNVLTTSEMIAGFSNPAVITIIGAFIMTHALYVTGVTHKIGRFLAKICTRGKTYTILVVMLMGAGLSLIMNKVVAAAVLLPAAIAAARRARIPLSKPLIPLAFATSLGGMATLLNTSNLVISAALQEAGFEGYGLLDFLPVGLPITALGIVFILLTHKWLLNSAGAGESAAPALPMSERLARWYQLGERLNEVHVPPDSPLVGKTIAQSRIGEQFGLTILAIYRQRRTISAPLADEVIEPGDVLAIVGRKERVQQLAHLGVAIEPAAAPDINGAGDETLLFEVILSPRSLSAGITARQLHFRKKFRASIVALWHGKRPIRTDLADRPLQHGDAMLVCGTPEALTALNDDPDFIVLHAPTEAEMPPNAARAGWAILIIAAALLISALGIVTVAESMLLGAMAMVITGCMRMEEAYRAVDWKVIFLIAGMSSVSTAMFRTGAADLLGQWLIAYTADYSPLVIGFSLLLMTMLVTQIVSGQVAAFFLAPIAINVAQRLGVDPRVMALFVAFGGSLTFLTPTAHAANLLVMGPGEYAPLDYARAGLPLTLVLISGILIVTSTMLSS